VKSEAPQYDQIKKGVVLGVFACWIVDAGDQNLIVENANTRIS